MTKNKEEENEISNQVFNNWKNHDCTKSLIKIIDDCVETIKKLSLKELEGVSKINVDQLYFCRGGKYIAEQIKEKLLNKQELEHFSKEEENVNA
jgi:hypothetical protein